MCKVPSGPLLSIQMLCCIQWFRSLTVNVLPRLRGCARWYVPLLSVYFRRHVFAWRGHFKGFIHHWRRNVRKRTLRLVRKLRSCAVWSFLCCPHEETLHPRLSKKRPVKILIRLGAHVRRVVFGRCGSDIRVSFRQPSHMKIGSLFKGHSLLTDYKMAPQNAGILRKYGQISDFF